VTEMTDVLNDMAAARVESGPGYPGGGYPSPRRMGQFDRLQVGGFEVVPEDQVVTRTYFGLRHQDTFFDALFTTASGTFQLISHDVRSAADGSLSAFPFLGAFRSTPAGMVPDPRYAPWSGAITQTLSADGRIVYAVPQASSPAEVSFDGVSLEWTSTSDDIHLSGELSGNGTQYRLGWRQPDSATGEMFYNHQGYSVEGAYFGEPATGHVIVETMWGSDHYTDTWWVQNRVGHWASFANNYDDGSSEYGQILCGEYGARGAVIVDRTGQPVVCTTNVNAYEEANDRVRYEFGNGETWVFIADPSHGFDFPGTRLGVGCARRQDEKRGIVNGNGTYLTAQRMPQPLPFG
jgi:hypothetical protein